MVPLRQYRMAREVLAAGGDGAGAGIAGAGPGPGTVGGAAAEHTLGCRAARSVESRSWRGGRGRAPLHLRWSDLHQWPGVGRRVPTHAEWATVHAAFEPAAGPRRPLGDGESSHPGAAARCT